MKEKKLITLIIPCYNEEEVLSVLYIELNKVMDKMQENSFELIFVDDGSSDATLHRIQELAKKDGRVKYISFSRNFGKESAMYAGLQHAKGDFVAFMDADMQDPPQLLPQMYEAITKEGYDSVATRRTTRKGEPVVRSIAARIFYKIINKISDAEIVDGARDFRLMTRQMADAVLELSEYNRFTKGIFGWVGFKTKWLPFQNVERAAGETKWNFWKLFKYSLDGIVNFSTVPLQIASVSGIGLCFLSFLMIIFIIVRKMLWGDSVAGWPSLVCIIMFLSGIQMFSIGVLGQYLSKTYLESKNRPIYIVHHSNIEEDMC